MTTDSSDYGIGAQLSQMQHDVEVPIAFASRTLSAAERNYATNEREALACLWACEHWSKFLLGRHFILRSDHSNLTTLLAQQTSTRKSSKFVRWLERLSVFDYKIQYSKQCDNAIADYLSRLPQETPEINQSEDTEVSIRAVTIESGISIEEIQNQTKQDTVLNQVFYYAHNKWPVKATISTKLRPYYMLRDDIYIDERILMYNGRIVIPSTMQNLILTKSHEGHPGIVRMKRQLRRLYWWPCMDKHVEQFVRYCQPCQDSAKSHKPIRHEAQTIPYPTSRGVKWLSTLLGHLLLHHNINDTSYS